MVRLGASFPQTEIGTDPAVIREWAIAVEDMGFDYVVALDHVLGARPGHPALAGSPYHYTSESLVHEPLILFGFLAAITQRVELMSAILILPQRQTALVAKQAAEVDVLSGGRLRLGVGLGWNPVEFEALGEDFHNRGSRIEEQIEVMRLLWTQEVVSFHGRWHTIDDAGIHPRPVRRPIPVWFGATADRAIERIGRIGDGWLAMGRPDAENVRRVQLLRESAQRAGRDPASVGLQASVGSRGTGPDDWLRDFESWRSLGASNITIGTTNPGHTNVAAHLEALRRVHDALAPLLV